MKPFRILPASVLVLIGLSLTAGCGTVAVGGGDEGPGVVPVYGGYEGAWNNGYVEYGGADHYRPPYHADDHGGGDAHVEVGARPAPAARSGPPSIPNQARPSGGGGGGGHPGGGGGGGGHSSGGHKP